MGTTRARWERLTMRSSEARENAEAVLMVSNCENLPCKKVWESSLAVPVKGSAYGDARDNCGIRIASQ